jgi:hypothetical protein
MDMNPEIIIGLLELTNPQHLGKKHKNNKKDNKWDI